MAYVFYKNHIYFFLSVLKKNEHYVERLKILKHNVRTTLQLAYHGSKKLTHTSKHVK